MWGRPAPWDAVAVGRCPSSEGPGDSWDQNPVIRPTSLHTYRTGPPKCSVVIRAEAGMSPKDSATADCGPCALAWPTLSISLEGPQPLPPRAVTGAWVSRARHPSPALARTMPDHTCRGCVICSHFTEESLRLREVKELARGCTAGPLQPGFVCGGAWLPLARCAEIFPFLLRVVAAQG